MKSLNHLVSFISGLIFAIGLGLSGMTLPSKVIGFLDLFGEWDPALMWVMGGAATTYMIVFRLVQGKSRPILASRFAVPTRKDITPRLLLGAVFFGAGWGIAGFCPGPAITSIAAGHQGVLVFGAAMVTGMYLFKWLDPILARAATPAPREAPPSATATPAAELASK